MCLTGADLSSAAKPWKIQFNTTSVVYAEFYDQVDKNPQFMFTIFLQFGRFIKFSGFEKNMVKIGVLNQCF